MAQNDTYSRYAYPQENEPHSPLNPLLDAHTIPSTSIRKNDLAFLEKDDQDHASRTSLMSKISGPGPAYRPVIVSQVEFELQETTADRPDTEKRNGHHQDRDEMITSDWRPFVMRTPYIIFIILLSLILASGQEALCQYTTTKGPLLTFGSVQDLTTLTVFCWRYLPVLIVIIYGMFVATLDHQIMRLAPFYKLGRPQGLRGSESLLREPANYFYYLSHPHKAGPLILSSSLSSLVALVVIPPLQTVSIISTFPDIYDTDSVLVDPTSVLQSRTTVSINPVWSRALSAALVLVAFGMVSLIFFLRRQPSNLAENPYGVAGMIAATNETDMRNFLVDLGTDSTETELNDRLSDRRFVLRNGCIDECISMVDREIVMTTVVSAKHVLAPQRCIPPLYQLILTIFLGISTTVLSGTMTTTVALKFLNHNQWFSTAIAVSFKLLWGQFEVFLRSTEPYYQLSRGKASPSALFVDYTGLPVFMLSFEAMRCKRFTLALQGACSVLAEVVVVCVSSLSDPALGDLLTNDSMLGVPDSQNSFWTEAMVSVILGIALPVIMLASMVTVCIRRRNVWLPRKPGTIANTWLYVHDTQLLRRLKDLQYLSPIQRKKTFCAGQKKYLWDGLLVERTDCSCGLMKSLALMFIAARLIYAGRTKWISSCSVIRAMFFENCSQPNLCCFAWNTSNC